jgi:type III pantothenate kinase
LVALAIDIGNTRIKACIFENGIAKAYFVFKTMSIGRVSGLIKRNLITHCIICNSGKLDLYLKEYLNKHTYLIVLDHTTRIPIYLNYLTPNTLGRDRISACVGAWLENQGGNSLIINMGTCITMDVVGKEGKFLGGNISPGVTMRMKAMHKFTASLPLVDLRINNDVLGIDTASALQNGGVVGAFREVETFISEMKEQFGEIKVFLAGGDAYLFEKYTKNVIFARPNIVLQGLIEILRYNAEENL